MIGETDMSDSRGCINTRAATMIALHNCEVDGVDSTPYQTTLPQLIETAKRLGIARVHKLIDGTTGRMLSTPIVCGPMLMQRLRHHAEHKAFACGPLHPISTRTHRCPGR